MYACVCIYVCVHMCVCVCLYLRTYVHMCVCTCICAYMCVFVYRSYVYAHVCTGHVCTYVCAHVCYVGVLVMKGIIGYLDYSFQIVMFESFETNQIFVFFFNTSQLCGKAICLVVLPHNII